MPEFEDYFEAPILDYRGPAIDEDEDRIIIWRPPEQILGRLLINLVGFPIAFFLGGVIFAGLLGYLLFSVLGLPEGVALLLSIGPIGTAFILLMIWCVRDGIRRAFFRVVVYRDRLESTGPLSRWRCSYDEVSQVNLFREGVRFGCIISTKGGEQLRLSPDVVSFAAARPAL